MSEIRTRLQDSTPFFPNMLNNGSVEVCLKEDVDKVIAEKDAEIALLKERICNGDVSRLTWIDDCLAKDNEIEELKQKLGAVNELVKESKELLKESQKMHQRCADNASKQIRRLKRAVWLERAERYKIREFTAREEGNLSNQMSWSRILRERTYGQWVDQLLRIANLANKLQNKCLAKAEEYK